MQRARIVLVGLVSLLALLAVACTEGDTLVQAGANNSSGISASGNGRAVGKPDLVVLQLGVSVERPSVEAARQLAATSMQASIDSMKANGVEDKDIQTVQFQVNPQYDFFNNRQTLRGYNVTNTVTARIRKLDTVGKVLDDATRAGGDNAIVQSLRFTIEDPTKLQEQARDLAVKQARSRAEQLANPAGVKLGRVLAVTESTGLNQPPQPFNAGGIVAPRTGPGDTPIQQGELEVVINVVVLFAIDD